ncbi:hypothetical protein AAG906_014841 [Vitis piasezkii]
MRRRSKITKEEIAEDYRFVCKDGELLMVCDYKGQRSRFEKNLEQSRCRFISTDMCPFYIGEFFFPSNGQDDFDTGLFYSCLSKQLRCGLTPSTIGFGDGDVLSGWRTLGFKCIYYQFTGLSVLSFARKLKALKDDLKHGLERSKINITGPSTQLEDDRTVHERIKQSVEILNRMKDIVCLIISYPPMSLVNGESYKRNQYKWVQDILKINDVVREMEAPSKKKEIDAFKLENQISTLMTHYMDEIEPLFPQVVIAKSFSGIDVERHGQIMPTPKRMYDLAVDFAIREILQHIEYPKIRKIGISGSHGVTVISELWGKLQECCIFDHVIDVEVSRCSTIEEIRFSIERDLFPSTSGERKLDETLKGTNFFILLHEVGERVNLYDMGTNWWNSKKIQKYCALFRDPTPAINVVEKCCGHLLAVVIMARALKDVNDVLIWEYASYTLGLQHRSQTKDRVLFNALAFMWGRSGSTNKYLQYCVDMEKRGQMEKVHLIEEWITSSLVGTFDEGEQISFQYGDSNFVRMRREIHEELLNFLRFESCSPFPRLGGWGLTEPPKDEEWEKASEMHLMNYKLSDVVLQSNHHLRTIPPRFFEGLPVLQILDLSYTRIRSLPRSLLIEMLERVISRIQKNQSSTLIPRNVIQRLFQLQELRIDVNPDDERWNATMEDIVKEVCIALLDHFMRNGTSLVYTSLVHFRFVVGSHHSRIISRLPNELAIKFELHGRSLKYVNGEGIPSQIKEVLQHCTALFLDRHLTLTKLSEFGIGNMKKLEFCVLGECYKIETIVGEAENCNQREDDGDVYGENILGSLQFLRLHYMKNLVSIWKGPVWRGCLSSLKSLALHECPQLTTIFTLGLLENLNSLEELVAEWCPEINSIWFTISPKLEWMSFYNCPRLETLSDMEVCCNSIKVIIGEADWWSTLKNSYFGLAQWHNVFVPIKSDEDLATQLEEIENQLLAERHERKPSRQSGSGDFTAPAFEATTASKEKQLRMALEVAAVETIVTEVYRDGQGLLIWSGRKFGYRKNLKGNHEDLMQKAREFWELRNGIRKGISQNRIRSDITEWIVKVEMNESGVIELDTKYNDRKITHGNCFIFERGKCKEECWIWNCQSVSWEYVQPK